MRADAENTLKEHGVICHSIPIERSPLRLRENLNAYRALKSLLKKEHFAGVHCHTPMGGVVGRLAANAAHTAPVLYTAHGFHFYKGCPLKNRLIYQTARDFFGPLYRCPDHHQSGGLRCRTEIPPAWQGVLCTRNRRGCEEDLFHAGGPSYKAKRTGASRRMRLRSSLWEN